MKGLYYKIWKNPAKYKLGKKSYKFMRENAKFKKNNKPLVKRKNTALVFCSHNFCLFIYFLYVIHFMRMKVYKMFNRAVLYC